MRRPDLDLAVLALEFGTAVADQVFQRVGGGGDAERLHLVARRPRQRGEVFLLGGEAELFCQFGIERRNGGRGAVIGLRGFVEAGRLSLRARRGEGLAVWGAVAGRRLNACAQGRSAHASRFATAVSARRGPRAMRGGLAAGAAVPGIVRRRLQSGAGAQAGIAAVDRGIEQFRQRRPDRLHVGPDGPWISGFCRAFWECRDSSPWGEYGMSPAAQKRAKEKPMNSLRRILIWSAAFGVGALRCQQVSAQRRTRNRRRGGPTPGSASPAVCRSRRFRRCGTRLHRDAARRAGHRRRRPGRLVHETLRLRDRRGCRRPSTRACGGRPSSTRSTACSRSPTASTRSAASTSPT